jgi:hypothetical protein
LRTITSFRILLRGTKKIIIITKYTSKKGRFNFSATLSRAPLVGIDLARPCNYNTEQ